jgi:hypothetical protein
VFAGHVPESVEIREAVNARQKSMEHLFGIAMACSSEEFDLRARRAQAIAEGDPKALRQVRERAYKTFENYKCAELFRAMARYDVWQTPTLTLRQRLALMGAEKLASDPRVKQIPRLIREQWSDPSLVLKKANPETLEDLRGDYEFHRKLVGMMGRYGVPILAGTDTGDPYVVPGAALHDELTLLVEAGLSPMEAIRVATVNAARYFGIEATHGTIQRGKSADLIVLDANPLTDIRNTRKIRTVILRGRVLDRKRLDRMLAE